MMIMKHRGTQYEVSDLAAASAKYSALRDESGEGASTFPDGEVWSTSTGLQTGRISYNGRVWVPGHNAAYSMLYDPSAGA